MDLKGMFASAVSAKVAKEIAGKMGIKESTAATALGAAMPLLLKQLGKNASTEEGAKAIDSAIEKGHNTADINLNSEDGEKILNHLYENSDTSTEEKANLAKAVAEKAGLDESKSGDLVKLASSFMMENLGKAKNEGNLDSSNLGGVLGMAGKFLDKDGDGDVKDDLLTMAMNFVKSKFLGK